MDLDALSLGIIIGGVVVVVVVLLLDKMWPE